MISSFTPFNPYLPSKQDTQLYWGGLSGVSQSLALYHAALHSKQFVVAITPDTLTANRLEEEIQFFNANDAINVMHFPDWETLPYDQFSPHQDIISQRLHCLYQLPELTAGLLIVPITTLMHRILPQSFIRQQALVVKVNDQMSLENFRTSLNDAGYRCVSQVMEHGEYAIRGSIIDLYPMGSNLPYRLDLFDNEIESIRHFDPHSQRTLEKLNEINLLPAQEYPLDESGITFFRQSWRAHFPGNPIECDIYNDVSQHLSPAGIEYYLPLFFEQTETLFDYFPSNTLIVKIENIVEPAKQFWQSVFKRYDQYAHDRLRPLLKPEELFIRDNHLFEKINCFQQIQSQQASLAEKPGRVNYAVLPIPQLLIDGKAEQPLHHILKYIKNSSRRTLFCADSAGRREILLDLFRHTSISLSVFHDWRSFIESNEKIGIMVMPLECGVTLIEPGIDIIAESQLYGTQAVQRRKQNTPGINPDAIIRDLSELNLGAPVVHIDHGIGHYDGLTLLTTHDIPAEYLTIIYAEEKKLYVPIANLHLISRYTAGDQESVKPHSLGSAGWEKAKRKAAEKIHDVAAELLDIYSRRQLSKGFAFQAPNEHYYAFSAAFPFDETPDQAKAIEQVNHDMTSPMAMDRLVCGDVGFGKTEVAIRAACLATQNNKQVAVLVPTTLLAEQHHESFSDRFADWPIKIETLSRFRSLKEQKIILSQLAEGKIDIIIGTHKLLQQDVKFNDLGLLIIDEEHRFGVRHKERLKSLRANVDILTLTATPIPRTLNMAMVGTRDLSIIATPPPGRLAIKTFLIEYNALTLREAIIRELTRGGQVYFLHNKVQSIEQTAAKLRELIPEARVGIAHGQMSEHQLEEVMSKFYHKQFNILCCTTIIESGIDIPTANTIIIDKANQFGLAQLHQLRGRVGRSHHQAYAYLIAPPRKSMNSDAIKRLDAITSMDNLGAGFTLATHDLEIRGAGELLGDGQSGHIHAIGFELYLSMLEQAVDTLKAGNKLSFDIPVYKLTEVDLQIPALIPEDYLPDVHMRLSLYKRIASAQDINDLKELQIEMIDRFGLLPDSAKNLFAITELKLKAIPFGISRIILKKNVGKIHFSASTKVEPRSLVDLLQSDPARFRLQGPEILVFSLDHEETTARINAVSNILKQLAVK